MDLGLGGERIVVTGGASGIGLATARLLLAEKARVVLWDRSPDVGETAARLVRELDIDCTGRVVDITDGTGVQQAAALDDQAGAITGVIHCAAIGSGKFGFPFTNLSPADWPRVLEVNVTGAVNVVHALAPKLRDRRHGVIIFLASVAGQIGSQTDPPYSASKAAIINFAQCAAKDLAPYGVRVNTICPGMVQTPLNESVWRAWRDQQPPESRQSYVEWAAKKIQSVVPLGKWQTPDDIANMIVFLCSNRAANVTGQTINVDGGFVMHW